MPFPLPPKDRRDFEVAIICALQLEADAVEALFDHVWDEDVYQCGKVAGDQNAYRTGVMNNHHVVLAYMPGMGKGHAASVSASFRSGFERIKLALVVGICGGVPNGTENEIFLGDVIISDEILPYDSGRRLPSGFKRKTTQSGSLSMPNPELQAFLVKMGSREGYRRLRRRAHHHLTVLQKRTGASSYYSPV